MKNILKYNKIMLIICMVVAISFNLALNCYTIAASNNMNISGPSSVEEGKTITFTITFADNVNNIWLSDGDIIKNGFSGTVKVNKVSDRSYTVIISNIANVGSGKYIIVNSGVGYIDGIPIDSVTSNIFEITAKKEVNNTDDNNNNNNNNTGNNNGNNNDSNVDSKPTTKPDNNENVEKPSTDNTNSNKPNTNNNSNSNSNSNSNNTNNNTSNNTNTSNTNTNINQPTTDNTVENVEENVQNDTEIEEVKIKREIPNTGKLI